MLSEKLKDFLLNGVKKAVIIPHISPDGDAIGSCTALSMILDKKGINNAIVTCDFVPDYLNFLHKADSIISNVNNTKYVHRLINDADVIFMMDHNSTVREGDLSAVVACAAVPKLIIDHHLNPAEVDFVISDTSVSSTCELLYLFFCELWGREIIDADIANSLYTGINTDTGGFAHNSSNSQTFRIVGDLLDLGLNKDYVHEQIYHRSRLSKLRLLGNILLNKLEVNEKWNVAIMPITFDELNAFNFKDGDLEGVVNMPLSIKGVNISVQITQKKDKIKLSFRSKGDIPVNIWASEHFNGGGHKNAAGGQLYATLDEAIAKVNDTMEWFCSNYSEAVS